MRSVLAENPVRQDGLELQAVDRLVERDPGSGGLVRLEPSPGDYVWVPPHVPHREENPSPDTEAVVVIARSTQEAIVVDLDDLVWVGPVAVGKVSPEQRTWHEC